MSRTMEVGAQTGEPRDCQGTKNKRKQRKQYTEENQDKTEIKQQRKTLEAGHTIESVFFGGNVAGKAGDVFTKTWLMPVSVFWCLGVLVLWF